MTDDDAPVLIELDQDDILQSPADAPPIAEFEGAPTGQAMQTMAALASTRPSLLVRWFWRLLLAILIFFASVSAWNAVAALLVQNPVLGWLAVALLGLFLLVCLGILIREWAALARLQKIDGLHSEAEKVIADNDLPAARLLAERLAGLYRDREDMRWGRDRLTKASGDSFDADTLLGVTEDILLKPLDDRARIEIETAARQVAIVTALVPLAFADVIAALTANVRMIRRIAEVYGGRSGFLGGWRLTRAVMTHLVATGAVAIGDDLIGSLGGGQLLGKLSRRFGEGLINGALTARVGIAAMEVCRPLPFRTAERPRVTRIVQRALTGLFTGEGKAAP